MKPKSLFYFCTGAKFHYQPDNDLGGDDMEMIIDLHKYLLRNTRVQTIQYNNDIDDDHGWGGPRYTDMALGVRGIFELLTDQESRLNVGVFDRIKNKLTLPRAEIWHIDSKAAERLYIEEYLVDDLTPHQIKWIQSEDRTYLFYSNWNKAGKVRWLENEIKMHDQQKTGAGFGSPQFDALVDESTEILFDQNTFPADRLGFYSWLLERARIQKDDSIFELY